MRSTMQDVPLSITSILLHGTTVHHDSEVVTATADGTRSQTYAALGERAARLANALRALGIDGDQRVATFMWNNAEHLEAYLAIPSMGAVLHTLNIRLFPEQLTYIAEHADDKVVLVDDSLVPLLAKLLPTFTTVEHVLVAGPEAGAADLDSLRTSGKQVHLYEDLLAAADPTFDWVVADENDAMGRKRTADGMQTPVAYLVCNFSRPVGEKDGKLRPATFTHDEVTTLFHETGHGLHHMLTRVEELGVSGISGVEWDAVELPSQFMENFCWEWDVLQGMSSHVDTDATLPRELFDKMLAAKNFLAGMQTARQIEFSLFDLLLHNDFDPLGDKSVLQLLEEVRNEVAVVFPPDWHRFPNSFSHIFAGGYAAGYYSYKWAEVLSADCYAAFEEAGNPFDPETGRRFLDEILSVGGIRSALDSFKAFRGREPSPDALLRHSGMINA